jgi:hypothetical protein
VAETTAIYLMPQAWGIGAGRQLMTAAMNVLAGAGYRQATLWVLDSNQRAQRSYQAGSWRADGTVKTDDTRGFPSPRCATGISCPDPQSWHSGITGLLSDHYPALLPPQPLISAPGVSRTFQGGVRIPV